MRKCSCEQAGICWQSGYDDGNDYPALSVLCSQIQDHATARMKTTLETLRGARIAIIYPKAIGDFMFALPALHSLRLALPGASLLLVVKEKQEPLARGLAGHVVDEVIALGGRIKVRHVRRKLSQWRADAIIDLVGNDQSGLIVTLRGGRRIRPDWHDCKGMGALYTASAEAMPRLPAGLHRVDQLLFWLGSLGVPASPVSFRLFLPARAVELAQATIERYRLASQRAVFLNVGASRACKRWPARHFRKLAGELVKCGHRVVITGAAEFRSDRNYDRGVSGEWFEDGFADGDKCINLIANEELAQDLHLQRDAYLLRYSGAPLVVVGNDTGPMQIAGSVGEDAHVPTITLFGPTDWHRYGPYDSTRTAGNPAGGCAWIIPACGLPCLPADGAESCSKYRRGCNTEECMASISPDVVIEAVLRRIKGLS